MRGAAEDTTAKKATNIRKAENLKPEEKKKKKKVNNSGSNTLLNQFFN